MPIESALSLAAPKPAAAPITDAGAALGVLQVGALAAVLAAMPGRWSAFDAYTLSKELAVHAAVAVALTLLLASRRLRGGPVELVLVLFLAWGALSAATAAANPWAAARSYGLALAGAVAFWSARCLRAHGEQRDVVAAAAVAVAVAAGTALLEAYGGLSTLSYPGRAPGGTLGHRNHMAHLVVLGLPALLLLARAGPGRAARLGWLCAAAGSVMALVLSRSRGAWIGALVAAGAGVLLLWLVRRRTGQALSWRGPAVVSFVAVAAVGAAVLLPNRLSWRGEAPYRETLAHLVDYSEGSGRGRLIQYATTAEIIRDHPLTGVGPGNWHIQYPRYAPRGDPSYAPFEIRPVARLPLGDWLGIAAEWGIVGLLLLGLAGCMIARDAWRQVREGVPVEALAGAATLCTLLALLVMGSVDAVLHQPAALLVCAVILGALGPPDPAGRTSHAPRRALLAGLVAVPLWAFAAYSGLRVWAGSLYRNDVAIPNLVRAVRINPGDYPARVMLAEQWLAAGECDAALGHLARARRLYPTAVTVSRLEAHCASPRRTRAGGPENGIRRR